MVLLFSSLLVTHPVVTGFDFIVITPLLLSHCGFSFVFGCGVSFLVSSSVFLSMTVQQLVVILVLSQVTHIFFKKLKELNMIAWRVENVERNEKAVVEPLGSLNYAHV